GRAPCEGEFDMNGGKRTALMAALYISAASILGACGGGGGGYGGGNNPPPPPPPPPTLSESHSGPLALTSDGTYVWSVNPATDSVSVLDVGGDRNRKVTEIPVGKEPRCIAITPDNRKVYVTNAVSGNVYVLDGGNYSLRKVISVGTE